MNAIDEYEIQRMRDEVSKQRTIVTALGELVHRQESSIAAMVMEMDVLQRKVSELHRMLYSCVDDGK